jgi:hypothetical protein
LLLRYPRLIGFILFLGLTNGPLQAQTILYQARVKSTEAFVRGRPSLDAKVYPTNKLKRGDLVKVVEDREDGWLGIVPPPGSISWINRLLVEPMSAENPSAWTVSEAGTKTYYQSANWNEQPSLSSAELAKGTLLVSVGSNYARPDTGGVWLRIKPPPSEVRYIEAKDVEKDEAKDLKGTAVARAQTGDAIDPTLPPSQGEISTQPNRIAPVPSLTPNKPPSQIVEAQQAERLGDREKAIKLWIEAGRAYEKENNFALRNQCWFRADALKKQTLGSRPQNSCCVPCTPAQQRCWPGTMDGRVTAAPASRLEPVPVQPAYNANSGLRTGDTVSWNPSRSQSVPESTLANPAPANVFRGTLTSASKMVDGKPAYLLQSARGELISYVVGEQGMDLDRYLKTSVELHGVLSYRSDLRANLLRAASVQELR